MPPLLSAAQDLMRTVEKERGNAARTKGLRQASQKSQPLSSWVKWNSDTVSPHEDTCESQGVGVWGLN